MVKCLINNLHVKNGSWRNIQEDIMTFMIKKFHGIHIYTMTLRFLKLIQPI